MTEQKFLLFEDRGLLAVTGGDSEDFLQGLISNDIGKVGPERAIHTAFLTPQGRYLHDFFIVRLGDALLLDCEAARRDDLQRRLTMYKLHADIDLADKSDEFTAAAFLAKGRRNPWGFPEKRDMPFLSVAELSMWTRVWPPPAGALSCPVRMPAWFWARPVSRSPFGWITTSCVLR